MKLRIFVVVVVVAAGACSKDTPAPQATPDPETRTSELTVEAVKVPPGSLKQLPWLMGTFRGAGIAGTEQEPFFERNSLVNDSTLIVESFENASLTGHIDTTQYELRRDSLTNTGHGRYIATAFSPDSVTFGPLANVNNFFTWRRGDDSSWVAMIFPFGNSADVRAYKMTRIR
jgi:hypothetical protein